MTDDVLLDVYERLAAPPDEAAPDPVVGPEADAEARKVLVLADDADDDRYAEIILATARLYWQRFICSIPDQTAGRRDLRTAASLYRLLYADRPDLVPPAMQRLLDRIATGSASTADDSEDALTPATMSRFAFDLQASAVASGAIEQANEALRWHQAVLRMAGDEDDRSGVLTNLGVSWLRRYHLSDQIDDLDRALTAARLSVQTGPASTAAARYTNLVAVLKSVPDPSRGEQFRSEYADALGAAARFTVDPVVSADFYLQLGQLLLIDGFEQTGSETELRAAVAAFRLAAATLPQTHADSAAYLGNIGYALNRLYDRTGDPAAATEAHEVLQQSMDAILEDDPDIASGHANLGNALINVHEVTQSVECLRKAVERHRTAVALTPHVHADHVAFLHNLGSALSRLYDVTGDFDVLDESMRIHQETVLELPEAHPDRAIAEFGYGTVLWRRWNVRGDRALLEASISAFHAAVDHTHSGSTDRAGRLVHLGQALAERFGVTGDRTDLRAAVDVARQAVQAAPSGHADRSGCLTNLGNALVDWFNATGDRAALDEAVIVSEEAVRTNDLPADRGSLENNFAGALIVRFGAGGDIDDLDRGIAASRRAVDQYSQSDEDWRPRVSSLAAALHARFEHTGEAAALHEAIDLLRAATRAAPPGSPGAVSDAGSLGGYLFRHYRISGDPDILTEAASYLRQSVDATSLGAVRRADLLSMYGLVMAETARARARPEYVDEAVALSEEAAAVSVSDLRAHGGHLANLGSVYVTRFDLAGNQEDLDKAIDVMRMAGAAFGADDRMRAMCANSLGAALTKRHVDPHSAGRAEALRWYREAAGIAAAPIDDRARAAQAWGRLAMLRGDRSAVEGFALAVDLQDQLAWRGMDHHDRQRLLREFSGLAVDAAASALASGEPERAVELLERGRSVIMRQLLEGQSDLDVALEHEPELAGEFRGVLSALGTPSTQIVEAGLAPPADQRNTLARRHAELLAALREKGYLRPPVYAEIGRAGSAGPVVVVNVSRARCDAIVLDGEDPRVCPLPDVTLDEVVEKTVAVLNALGNLARVTSQTTLASRQAQGQILLDVLAWLWDRIAQPILEFLEIDRPEAGEAVSRRLWWSPTGPLTFLPLHAAGRHGAAGQDSVIDRVVSSYAPTLLGLVAARAGNREDVIPAIPLAVAMPETPGAAALPNARREVEMIAKMFAARDSLVGPAATASAVLAALPRHSWVHFACHGTQDLDDPFAGRLLLHDRPVSVPELTQVRTSDASLAFLSACDTFRGGLRLPNETASIATALQGVGFRHVVAAMWTVSDNHAPEIAKDLYEGLKMDGTSLDVGRTAQALHRAVLRQREGHAREVAIWAPYAHVGP